jgi:phenylalanyl-tRNA synthetase beta chain
MLVSYEWLSQYVDLEGISPEDIAEELNRTGIEVEVIYTRDPGVSGVIIGEVMSVERHPEADRLNVCLVNVGKGQVLQIVCGAKNVAAGQRVPVALVGAKLPGGLHIKKAKLRGVESNGMICSAQELGFPEKVLMKEQTEGILVLEPDAPIGIDIKEFLGMNDQVIELQLTPNRSDCLGMIGVAYEVAAIFDRELRLPMTQDMPLQYEAPINVYIESEEDCPFYAAQVVHDIKVGPSPQWMQNRLISAGIRPINNIVDITNYVMLETGQPLHAFDYNRVQGGQIIVRRALSGEQIVTLDGVTRTCDDQMLLITDGEQPLALAGVMGGESSEVTDETVTILLESAFFDPQMVRQTSRKVGLRSEASARFEKGVDPEGILPALARAVQLLCQIAGGALASEAIVKKVGDVEEMVINLRHERLVNLLGVQVDPEEVLNIFRRLQFPTEVTDEGYAVQIPTRRPDITIEVDLIEEVARLYGYDRIPTTLPWGQQPPGGLTEEQKARRVIRHTLMDLGLHEVLTYSLTSTELEQEVASLFAVDNHISLAMPMSAEHAVLRSNLLPHLIETASYNHRHGNERVQIFELAHVYLPGQADETLPEERLVLGGLLTGKQPASIWKEQPLPAREFYKAKGILDALFARLGVVDVEYQAVAPHGFHPGRTAQILIGGEVAGLLGELHPQLAKKHDLSRPVAFQLDVERLFAAIEGPLVYQPIPRVPAVTRDLAVVVDEAVPAGLLEEGIWQAGGELVESVVLFDVFAGEQIGVGKKNVAFSLAYRAADRTLTDEEVSAVHERVICHLEETFGAKLR